MDSLSMKVRAAALAIVVSAFAVSAVPARADSPFQGTAASSLISLIPDTCIPTGMGTYCIQFTNAAWQTSLAQLGGQNQMGSMMAQNLQNAALGQITSGLGIGDVSGSGGNAAVQTCAQQTYAIQATQNGPADCVAATITQNAGSDNADLDRFVNEVGYANGSLSAAQIQSQLLVRLLAELQRSNQFGATQQQQQRQQQKAEAAQTAASVGGLLDVTNSSNAVAGWDW